MKKIIAIAAIATMGFSANAATPENENAAAKQTSKLVLSNAIEITFMNTESEVGSDVSMSFNTVNDYANGVESKPNMLLVRSNKDFNVTVKTNDKMFTYDGKEMKEKPEMPVEKVLNLMVSENNTGGEVAGPFSEKEFASLSAEEQKLIVGGSRGGKQTFAVQYKATPGFEYPGGTYSVDVVYTATQQ